MHLITLSEQVEVLQVHGCLTGRHPVAIVEATSLGHLRRANLSPYGRVADFAQICGPCGIGPVRAEPTRFALTRYAWRGFPSDGFAAPSSPIPSSPIPSSRIAASRSRRLRDWRVRESCVAEAQGRAPVAPESTRARITSDPMHHVSRDTLVALGDTITSLPSPCRPDDFRWLLLLMHRLIAFAPQVDPTGSLGVSGMLTCYSLSDSRVTPGHRLVVDATQESPPRRPAVIPNRIIWLLCVIYARIGTFHQHLGISLPQRFGTAACGHHRTNRAPTSRPRRSRPGRSRPGMPMAPTGRLGRPGGPVQRCRWRHWHAGESSRRQAERQQEWSLGLSLRVRPMSRARNGPLADRRNQGQALSDSRGH